MPYKHGKGPAGTPSEKTVPHQRRFDHGVPFVGETTALPVGEVTGANPPIPTVTPSRFFEFIHRSHTNGKEGKT
jgi:hypothetical protein